MNKKRLILLTGDLATGKSTFARILAKRFELPCYHKDKIKEVLGDTIGFTNREENLKLSFATIQIMIHIFEEATNSNTSLILESNFHEHELEKIHEIARKNEYKVLTLCLTGDNKVLHARYLNRIVNENRHPVHTSTAFDKYEDFVAYLEHGRKENIKGDVININATNFDYQNDENLIEKILKFCE